jgi:heme/copper-type cytochrome/quinol oxidase subunit 3
MEARFLRIAYAIQFVVTWMVVFEIWGQVGGQGHIDMMPWYLKLLLSGGLSLTAVKATVATVQRDTFWNKRTSAWLAAAVVLAILMGLLSYYEHLHEPTEEEEEPPARLTLS